MPRLKTYWEDPDKYRKQAREYSATHYKHIRKAQYVPRNNIDNLPTTLGYMYYNTNMSYTDIHFRQEDMIYALHPITQYSMGR